MISKLDYFSLVGLVTIGIDRRKAANNVQDALERWLKERGVSADDAYNWAGELVYNEGDDAAVAVDRVIEALELKVEE